MKKTVSINISGFAFVIEEEAYAALQKYLTTIRGYFTSDDGVDEIMTDIEIRIAELFKERLGEQREVIDQSDVFFIIGVLGQPEAFIDEETDESSESEQHKSGKRRRRRIFRDPDHKSIGGVASGLAAYFGIDPIWMRLLFIILTFGGFSGIPIYIIMWIVMPMAKTASDKLEMRGEPVTAENIGRTVSESFEYVKKNVGDLGKETRQPGRVIEGIAIFIGNLILLIFQFIGRLLGVIFTIVGITLLILFISSFFGFDGLNIISFGDNSYSLSQFGDISQLIIVSDNLRFWFFVALFVTILLPILGILYGGVAMLFGLKRKAKGISIALIVVWFIGLFGLISLGLSAGNSFKMQEEYTTTKPLNQVTSDTLLLTVHGPDAFSPRFKPRSNNFNVEMIKVDGENVIVGNPKLNVVENARDTIFEVVVYRSARGLTRKEAIANAENIVYTYTPKGNTVEFSPNLTFPKSDGYRNQMVYVEVRVPLGKSVHLDRNMSRIIYDIKNTTNTYDGKMVGKTWTMLSNGLTCLQCDAEDERNRENW